MRTGRWVVLAITLGTVIACGGSKPDHEVVLERDPDRDSGEPSDFHNSAGLPLDAGRNVGTEPGFGAIDAGVVRPTATGRVASDFLTDAGDGWSSLIEVEWELQADSEGYLCGRVTAPRDAYVHELSPLIPLGTHHNGLSLHPGGEAADGVEECGSETSGKQIFGAGVGSEATVLPDGVAMQVHAGEQMVLNLHLFNASSKTLKGRSGVRVRTIDKAEVENVAEIVLGGPLTLSIPAGGTTKQGGQCTFDHDATIFSVGPHMHRLGTHALITAHSSTDGDVTLYDGPYTFESQQRYPVDFVAMKAGDAVSIECTYQNDSDVAVGFGTSTLDEMCFASVMRFPMMPGSAYLCTN